MIKRLVAAVGWWIIPPAYRMTSPDHWRDRLGGWIVNRAASMRAGDDR